MQKIWLEKILQNIECCLFCVSRYIISEQWRTTWHGNINRSLFRSRQGWTASLWTRWKSRRLIRRCWKRGSLHSSWLTWQSSKILHQYVLICKIQILQKKSVFSKKNETTRLVRVIVSGCRGGGGRGQHSLAAVRVVMWQCGIFMIRVIQSGPKN